MRIKRLLRRRSNGQENLENQASLIGGPPCCYGAVMTGHRDLRDRKAEPKSHWADTIRSVKALERVKDFVEHVRRYARSIINNLQKKALIS